MSSLIIVIAIIAATRLTDIPTKGYQQTIVKSVHDKLPHIR